MNRVIDYLALGTRLKTLRRDRGLTLAQVSEQTAISSSFLSLVENGKSDMTLTNLVRLADLYGVGVSDLVEIDPSPIDQPMVIDPAQAPILSSRGRGIETRLLAGSLLRRFRPVQMRFQPGAQFEETVTHAGTEFILVVSGEIELTYGDRVDVISEGCSAYYPGSMAHRLHNRTNAEAVVFGVILEDEFA